MSEPRAPRQGQRPRSEPKASEGPAGEFTSPLTGHDRQREIEKSFLGKLSAARWESLSLHLAECDECRRHYDRLAEVERAMSGAPIPSLKRDRIGEALTRATAPSKARFGWRASWGAIGAIGALAAAALAAVFLAIPPDDGFRPRGTRFDGRPPGAVAFCIAPPAREGARPEVRGSARAVARGAGEERLACGTGDELQLAYSTPAEPRLYLVAYGESEDGRTHWYVPRSGDEQGLPLEADQIDRPLPWSTRLAVKHDAGKVRLRWLFFDREIRADEALRKTAVYELGATLVLEPE